MTMPTAEVYGRHNELPNLEAGDASEFQAAPAAPDVGASTKVAAASSAGAVDHEVNERASREEGQLLVAFERRSTTGPAPQPEPFLVRICSSGIRCFAILRLAIALVITAVFALLCLILCLPCICCWARRQGRCVILNGPKPPTVNKEAKRRIDAARAGTFHVRLDSFTPQVDNLRASFSRTMTRTMSKSQQVLGARSGMSVSPFDANPENVCDTAAKGDVLKKTRFQSFEQSGQSIPTLLMIRVQRANILRQTLAVLGAAPAIDLFGRKLNIHFLDENGIDAGGITRDWFDSLGRALVEDAERGDGHLMVLPDRTLAPRPYEDRFLDLLAIGRLIGLAVWFGIPLPIPLGSVTCKFMLDMPISSADIQRLDPDFVQFRITPVLRPSGVKDLEEALGEPLTFMSAATDRRASKELCSGGSEKRVTEENKHDYLKLLCEHHLCGDMQEQTNVLLEGFWDIFPQDCLTSSALSHRELALLISGYATLDAEVWRRHTHVNSAGCDQLIVWFWEMVTAMTPEDRAKLLHFATGSSRLPAGGFADVSPRFNISVQGDQLEHLPEAHTCGNQLVIRRYTSKDQLVQKMTVALSNDEGFGFA